MSNQLPAIRKTGHLTPLPRTALIPSLIADAGEAAAWRYVDFFTANIRNPNTRRAYVRACVLFFAWCEDHGLTLSRDPVLRCRHLYRDATAEPFGAGREAAARGRAHADAGDGLDRREHLADGEPRPIRPCAGRPLARPWPSGSTGHTVRQLPSHSHVRCRARGHRSGPLPPW